MKKLLFGIVVSLLSFHCGAQKKESTGLVKDPAFEKELKSLLSGKVPFLSVEELKLNRSDYVILDTREKKEYDVSHIPGARFLGYNNWDKNLVESLEKGKKIALYCSVGYRSEKIGERLIKAGFADVSNVYGSIFEWVNQGYPIVNNDNVPVDSIHTYNKKWGRWVTNQKIEKVW
jgi:rhodanese-related sulfurtransferase